MASPYSLGLKNAATIFDGISDGDQILTGLAALLVAFDSVVVGMGTLTTTDAAIGVAHGLGATPDFVLSQSSLAAGAGAASGKFGWAADATTITFTKADTGAQETFSYIVAVLA